MECRVCRQFTLRSMEVVLTLCFLAQFSPVRAHTERKYLYRGSKRTKIYQNCLAGGAGAWAEIYRLQVVFRALLQKRREMSSRTSHQILYI